MARFPYQREDGSYGFSDDALASFQEQGFLILDSFLDEELIARLKAESDEFEAQRNDDESKPPHAWREHGRLISHPPTMTLVEQLMGPGFGYHHLHSTRMCAGYPSVPWHHDYEQIPQSNRSKVMVHVFHYLNGLDGTIGDLLVWPGSQHSVLAHQALRFCDTADLPGSVVVDDLPPGSVVIVHSALLHARRAKPGGDEKPRYFIDCSYCEAGIRWPSTHNGHGHWRDKLRLARELGHDRDGRYAHLFDESHFFDTAEAHAIMQESGSDDRSIAEQLLRDRNPVAGSR